MVYSVTLATKLTSSLPVLPCEIKVATSVVSIDNYIGETKICASARML